MKLKYYEVTVIQSIPMAVPVVGVDEEDARKTAENFTDWDDIFDCFDENAVFTVEKVKSISRKRCEDWAEDCDVGVLSKQGFSDSLEEAEDDLQTALELHSDTCEDEEAE